jgi:hypothetical protein
MLGGDGQEGSRPMTDPRRHESADFGDYQPLDGSDSLEGPPGDDPLDRGVIAPQHWSAGMRHGTTAGEQADGESLDDLLAEEEPDETAGDELPGDYAEDLDADEEYEGGIRPDDAEPRAGRLLAFDEGSHPARTAELLAHDEGIDGGAASAEEAAMHVIAGDDADPGGITG